MKRKAQMQETTSTMIVGAIIFVVLLVASTTMNAAIKGGFGRESCKVSISKVQILKSATLETIKSSIDCPMGYVDIKQSDLPSSNPSNYVKKKFADAMYSTWYVSEKGENVRFSETEKGGQVNCLLYAKVSFKDIKDPEKLDLSGMKEWFSSNYPSNSETSYFSYLSFNNQQAYHIIDASDPNNPKETYSLDPRKNYYVVYWASMTNSKILSLLEQHIPILAEVVTNANALGGAGIPEVFVVPENEFKSIGCEALLN